MAVYAIEDDTNDLSDLGIGTSSASGKSSLSEDFDNHSVIVSMSSVNLIQKTFNTNFICLIILNVIISR